VLVWLQLTVHGRVVSENLATFAPPKDLRLANPRLKATVKKKGGGFLVTLTAQKPALWCWLDLPEWDAAYGDNFVHVLPEAPVQILVTPRRATSEAEFKAALRVRSVFDL
jgi:hypothetical protein